MRRKLLDCKQNINTLTARFPRPLPLDRPRLDAVVDVPRPLPRLLLPFLVGELSESIVAHTKTQQSLSIESKTIKKKGRTQLTK